MPKIDRVAAARDYGLLTPPFSAVVLAAGLSSRMGQDKALLVSGGRPLWRRQRDVLAEAGAEEIFLSARDNQAWAQAATAHFAAVVRDVEYDLGPLAGIAAAFDRATHSALLVLAVDLPAMTAEYLQRMGTLAGKGRGAVPAWPDGRTEPLCAVYPPAAAAFAGRQLDRGELRLQGFVMALEGAGLIERIPIAAADARLFVNWNKPEDAA